MAGLLALFVVLPAHAANITYNEKCDDGTTNCKFILINGDIMPGDAKKFSDLMATTTTRRLYLNSPGGLLDEGLAIAKVVHQQHNFETLVDNTDTCVSACAIIWLAGAQRAYFGKSKIGFHGVFFAASDKQGRMVQNSKTRPSSSGNAVLGAFFGRLGLSDEAITKLTEAGPDEMFYLNTKNIGELGITAVRLKTPKEKEETKPTAAPPARG